MLCYLNYSIPLCDHKYYSFFYYYYYYYSQVKESALANKNTPLSKPFSSSLRQEAAQILADDLMI